MENKNDSVTEVVYDKAKKYKRWFAFFIDFTIMVILGLFISAFAGYITNQTVFYKNTVSERQRIENESSLYNDGELIILSIKNEEGTVAEKKDKLNKAIEDFYCDNNFFNYENISDNKYYTWYQSRKKEAKNSNGSLMFVENSSNPGYYLEGNSSDQDYYDFYYNEIDRYCVSYLSLNSTYSSMTNRIVRTYAIEFVLSCFLGFLITFIFMPLILKRGRKTIGMYLFKISLISVDALNVKGWTLFGRDMLLIFIGYWVTICTFGIPLAVSVTMMHFTKTGQDFYDYVSNTYMVDTSKKDVYLNYAEYRSREELKERASIENKDYRIDNR